MVKAVLKENRKGEYELKDSTGRLLGVFKPERTVCMWDVKDTLGFTDVPGCVPGVTDRYELLDSISLAKNALLEIISRLNQTKQLNLDSSKSDFCANLDYVALLAKRGLGGRFYVKKLDGGRFTVMDTNAWASQYGIGRYENDVDANRVCDALNAGEDKHG